MSLVFFFFFFLWTVNEFTLYRRYKEKVLLGGESLLS